MPYDKKKYPTSAKALRLLYPGEPTLKTWRKWLKPLNLPKHIKIYSPQQLEQIITLLGEP